MTRLTWHYLRSPYTVLMSEFHANVPKNNLSDERKTITWKIFTEVIEAFGSKLQPVTMKRAETMHLTERSYQNLIRTLKILVTADTTHFAWYANSTVEAHKTTHHYTEDFQQLNTSKYIVYQVYLEDQLSKKFVLVKFMKNEIV